MKKIIAAVFAAVIAVPLFANPMPDAKAKKYLKKLAEKGKNYQRRTPQTLFFARAQLKYGLERSDYLRRWCDRPLMQDSGFAKAGTFKVDASGTYGVRGFINPKSYVTEAALLKRFNLTGLAFFPETTGRVDLYNRAAIPGSEMVILPELFYQFKPLSNDEIEARMKVVERALESPHTFRINGKIVITSYPITNNLGFWVELKKRLTAKHGDKFIMMPWVAVDYGLRPSGRKGKVKYFTVADIKKMEERVRESLRALDGFYYNTPPFFNRRYQWEFDREVVIPILHSVMSEPEFRNKYLAWGTKVGHMNCHVQNFGVDAFCTDTLRGSVGAAVLAKADFVNCVEWDEENENTCFRPMMTTGFSTLRIIRAFEQQVNGKKYSVLPGDDTSIPNLVLSYPRVLAAGQLIEFEIANVPDGTFKNGAQAVLELYDNNGTCVKKFAPCRIDTSSINAKVLTIPSQKLLKYRFINPVLTVNGKRFAAGFHPIEIRAWWHWDYLYAKHVLRDMPEDITASIEYGKKDKNGLIEATVKVNSANPIRSIEVISGDNLVVYSHSDKGEEFRETPEQFGFRVYMQSIARSGLVLNGSIEFKNTPGLKVSSRLTRIRGTAGKWVFRKVPLTNQPIYRFCSVPRSEVEKGEIIINLPGIAENKVVKLKDIARYGSTGFNGKINSALVICRNNLQDEMPEVYGRKSAEFKISLRPDMENAGYFVQVVDDKYRMFRSKKTSPFVPGGKMAAYTVFCVGSNKPEKVSVNQEFIREISWDFSGKRGAILPSSEGMRWDGILASFAPLATGYGQGETIYGNGLNDYLRRVPKDSRKAEIHAGVRQYAAPEFKVEDGRNILVFNGRSYASLPMGMIPPYCGYRIEMEVYIAKNGGKVQFLLSDTKDAFGLKLVDRVPVVTNFCNQNSELATASRHPVVTAKGPRLRPWQWNKIVVTNDQKTLKVTVNGVDGAAVPCEGYHRYPRATSLGAFAGGEFFTGKIRSLKIRPL